MTTLYFNAWAFRFRSPLIDAVMRQNWHDGLQSAFRYYYTEDAESGDDDEPESWDQRHIFGTYSEFTEQPT